MKITLKDGSIKEYAEAMSAYDIARDISEGLARASCAVEINGEVKDLRTVVDSDCEMNILTAKDSEGLRTVRHTCSHVLAEAVKRLFPNVKLAIGPSIDEGFYYDFESEPFSREDLDNLEKEMKKIIKEGNRLEKFTLPREEAIALMKEKEEPYKVELNAYLEHLEDIKKRDHNKLGREMELFTTVDVIGQGLPLIMPKGVRMIQTLQRWIEDLEDNEWGYIRTKTPLMAKSDLYKISGHWDHYKEGMFVLGDESKDKEVFALRPMTCPFQYYVYKNSQHSYRELPLRYSETSTLFRNEDSGEMHGLTRVRQFTISEGHLIVRPDQMVEEFKNCIALARHCLKTLGLEEDVTYHLSKWDPENREKYIGEPEVWEETQQHMRDMMHELGIEFVEDVGEAAFYGPKIDINAKNVYGKEDTMITIQWDALLAEQFDMYYIDANGDKVRPYIIHRTSMGCYERTLAWLIEKYAGKFPTWLCPEQVRVLPISDKYEAYAKKVEAELKKNGVYVSVDARSEKIGYKIRESRLAKVPYMLVVGEKRRGRRNSFRQKPFCR